MSSIDNKAIWPGWETVRLIGRGSFGAVYEIERDVLGEKEKAALKVISIPQSDSDISEMYSDGYDDESITSTFQSHLKNIVAEYTLMRKLNGSANVVNCDDVRYVQHDDGFGWDIYIKMELLTPLISAVSSDVDEEHVVKIGKDLCRALVQCRQFDIIHRDIKPQNIFVSPLGDYKLGDFGIAKTVEKTSGGTKIGTYKYMAPEVYNNQPYGAAADIYSLGLVLYWLLNERRMPFMPLPPAKLSAGMEEQSRLRRFNGEPIPDPAHGSKELKRIVLKACAFNQDERYHTAEEMLKDLEGLGNPVRAFGLNEAFDKQLQDTEEDDTVGAFGKISAKSQNPYFESTDSGTVGVFSKKANLSTKVKQSKEETEKADTTGTWNHQNFQKQENVAFDVQKSQENTERITKQTDDNNKKRKQYGIIGGALALALILLFVLLPKGQNNNSGVASNNSHLDSSQQNASNLNNSTHSPSQSSEDLRNSNESQSTTNSAAPSISSDPPKSESSSSEPTKSESSSSEPPKSESSSSDASQTASVYPTLDDIKELKNSGKYPVKSDKNVELQLPDSTNYLSRPFRAEIYNGKSTGRIYLIPVPTNDINNYYGNLSVINIHEQGWVVAVSGEFSFFVSDDGQMGWNGSVYFVPID